MLRILATIAPSTAASRSASSNTMNGALPPSSIDSRSRFSEACSISLRPTSVEPVNDSLRSRGSAISGAVVSPEDEAVNRLSTPPGRPASSRILASASIDSGVCCAGLTTIVQPAAIAGPILRVPIASGKFHGRDQQARADRLLHRQQAALAVGGRPRSGRRSAPPPRRTSAGTRPRRRSRPATRRAACPSRASSAAPARRLRSTIASNARRRISPRSRGRIAAHAGPASTAASARPWRPRPTRRRRRTAARRWRGPRPTACPWRRRATRRRCTAAWGPGRGSAALRSGDRAHAQNQPTADRRTVTP